MDAFSSSTSTTISADVPWGDYFAANRFIADSMHVRGVVAASGEGVVLPVANNVVPTLAPKLAIIAHQRVSGPAADFLFSLSGMGGVRSADLNRRWLDTARRAGFDTVVWGPVEESMWGVFGRKVLLDAAVFKASFGHVGIFQFPVESGADTAAAEYRNGARQAFLEKSSCSAYVRKRLRENQGQPYCDPALLLPPSPTMPDPGSVGHEIDLTSVAIARQSSIRSRMASHGPAHAIRSRPSKLDTVYEEMAITETERNAWWEVDLGRNYPLAAVQIKRAMRNTLSNS